MEAIEATTIGDKLRPLLLEHLPHRLIRPLRMGMRLGVGDALVHQPGVQLIVGLDPKPRGEEALAHQTDLVLDLALLPARGRRAGHRVNQMVSCTSAGSGDYIADSLPTKIVSTAVFMLS